MPAMSDAEFADYRATHPITAVRPLVQSLMVDAIADTGVVVALTDQSGRLLWIEGDSAEIAQPTDMRALLEDLRTDAERLGANDQLTTTALAAARTAIDDGVRARSGGDPLAALSALTSAERDLDAALAAFAASTALTRASRRSAPDLYPAMSARVAWVRSSSTSRSAAVR